MRRQPQIVRNQHHRGSVALLLLGQHPHDLRLRDHVQGGGGFVGEDQGRVATERHGDQDTLALPSRHLVRISRQHAGGIAQTDFLQTRTGIGLPLRRRYAHVAQMLEQLMAHRQRGIQARKRLLRNERDLPAQQFTALRRRQPVQVRAAKLDRAPGDLEAGGQGARHHAAHHALAGAGFTHQAQHAALGNLQVDAAQHGGGQASAIDVDVHGKGQVPQAQQRHGLSSFRACADPATGACRR
ncbi:hypothetical protein D3C86_822420 [compost metagenome]